MCALVYKNGPIKLDDYPCLHSLSKPSKNNVSEDKLKEMTDNMAIEFASQIIEEIAIEEFDYDQRGVSSKVFSCTNYLEQEANPTLLHKDSSQQSYRSKKLSHIESL